MKAYISVTAVLDVIKTVQQVRNGCLPGTRGPHKSHLLPRSCENLNIMQNRLVLCISKIHMVKDHISLHDLIGCGIIRMDKDIQYIFSVPQDIIRTSAYNNTGAFPRKIFYDLYLREIELVLQRLVVLITPPSPIGCITGDVKKSRLLFICSSFSSTNP